jgi:hypothetical protein
MILKTFFEKKLAFYVQNTASFAKIWIIALVFKANANFFAENCQKSPKILIVTSTPGVRCYDFKNIFAEKSAKNQRTYVDICGLSDLRVYHEDPALGRRQDDPVVGRQVVAEQAVHVPRLYRDLDQQSRKKNSEVGV